MNYSSTRGKDNNLSFINIMLNGLARDGGLYIPDKINKFSRNQLSSFKDLEYFELAYELTRSFVVSDEISDDSYKSICKKTYDNSFGNKIISIDKINDNEYVLNLFKGPTFAFKDYALQLLGNLYEFVLKKKKIKLTVIGATSGDTGSAAIYGCSKSKNIKMFILFPKGKVSEVQRKQMTTFEKDNVINIEVDGNFDDCQKLVKDFFKLNIKKQKYNLAAVNSINWVRILGQIVYYFWSFLRVEKKFKPISFVVPTGNFGNAYAGFISKLMGLPINKIIIASNKNDILTRFFSSGDMEKKIVNKSFSPSMDIQVSSNFERLLYYFTNDTNEVNRFFNDLDNRDFFKVKKELLAIMLNTFDAGKLSDEDTLLAIRSIFKNHNIIVDPHTAVGYSVGKRILKDSEKRIYLSTAHHGKFLDTVRKAIKSNINYPEKLSKIMKKKEKFEMIGNSLVELEKLVDSKTQI